MDTIFGQYFSTLFLDNILVHFGTLWCGQCFGHYILEKRKESKFEYLGNQQHALLEVYPIPRWYEMASR